MLLFSALIWLEEKMKLWSRIKLGAVPFVLAAILVFAVFHLWAIVGTWGLHLTGRSALDVPINLSIMFAGIYLFGCLFEWSWFQEFAKTHFHKIPVAGPIFLAIVLPRKLELVEIRTTPGSIFHDESGCWEYAIVTVDPWVESNITWYRVHTLGWTGKLFSRISADNVKQLNRPARDVWKTVFSMGLL